MKAGFYTIMAAQFFSSLADQTLLVAAIALVTQMQEPEWMTPALKLSFVVSYVVLAPLAGAFADSMPKGRVMLITNAIKVAGCFMALISVHPLLAYAVVGFGAAAYSPAKYGILTELLPPSQLVAANGWIEGTTMGSIVLGWLLGGALISDTISGRLLGFDMPLIDTGIATAPQAALCVVMAIYAIAAIFNWYIPDTGVDHLGSRRDAAIHRARLGGQGARVRPVAGHLSDRCRRGRHRRGGRCRSQDDYAAQVVDRVAGWRRDGTPGDLDDLRHRFGGCRRAHDRHRRLRRFLCRADERAAAAPRSRADGRRPLDRRPELQ
jgi:hypothetical protein